ncbi:Gfo/Idh/MocA family protein [Pontiella sulfatireligans]|uniref:Glucose--fructose oxidoreductase n=1 Tax=Pontiella sulfatireligans TaxID=2750658 RepID=A0A6C2UN71_9BACT|nr:Gfo/Idh/MocA family oxidoreductase [Pontiella sulfatireligans]VGO20496.1 Glucose--fructose oxidoreductase [Pontiella sulfatireligans]
MNPSRRSFIRSTAVAAGLPLFNVGAQGVSPNEKINHASFGAGGKAGSDIGMMMRTGHCNLVAVAEVDETRVGKIKKNYPEARIYKDWRVLLEKEHKNLDSVNVSTPDHMHAPIAVTAMKLGLHVFGQKPLAQNLYETRRMAEVAQETGVVTQMGIQLSSSTYERLAVRMIQDGVIGKVKEVHIFSHKTWGDPGTLPDRCDPVPETLDWDLWCGVGPKKPYLGNKYYHPSGWRKRLDYGTGTLGDMGCHIYSPMFGALGIKAPLSVKSLGSVPNKTNWAIDEKFEYIFPGNTRTAGKTVKVIWTDGAHRPPQALMDLFGEKMPKQGGIFIGTEGVLLAPHGGLPVPYPREKFADYRYPKFPARDHYGDYVDAIRGEDVKPIADFVTYGGLLTETVLLGALSSRFPNETLMWDAANLRFTNHDAANQFIRRTYRKGWKVDGLS